MAWGCDGLSIMWAVNPDWVTLSSLTTNHWTQCLGNGVKFSSLCYPLQTGSEPKNSLP